MNKTENKLVPELRFPEFLSEEEWEEKPLSKITDAIFDGTHQTPTYTSTGIPFFSVENIVSGSKNKFISKEDYYTATVKNKPENGDILITRIGKIGFSTIVNWNYEFSIYVTLACIKKSKYFNSYFLHSYFQSENYQKEIFSKSLLSAVPCKINMNELRETKVLLPKQQEQQKIADCLSTLDEIIIADTEKLETIKSHKKGLLTELFPIEGTKIPALRFKEFKNDWQEIKLGQVCTYFKGFAFQSKDYISNGRRIVRVSDMGFDYIKDETNAIYIDENKVELYNRWKLKKNDLIITTVGSKPPVYDSLVGRTIVVKSKDENSLLNQNSVCLRANELIEQKFLNSLFKRNVYISFIESIIRGNANQGSIALVDLFEYKFLLPELKEQQKIAQCLLEVDNLITAQTDKLQQLKDHKKGLMQRLFPQIKA